MNKKNIHITILYIILLLVTSASIFIYFRFFYFESCETNKIKLLISKNEAEYLNFKLREERIKCMTKTLLVTYPISKWEAYYYSIIFDDFSTSFKIPWQVYAAIIRIESNFKTTLVSPKKAKGLMQILEETGKIQSKKIEINYKEGETLWNDLLNIIIGCYYLSECIEKKGLENGIRSYLGGLNYEKNLDDEDISQYISQYKTTVWQEYNHLVYIYRGIIDEYGDDYKVLKNTKYEDSIRVNMQLFNLKDTIKVDSLKK